MRTRRLALLPALTLLLGVVHAAWAADPTCEAARCALGTKVSQACPCDTLERSEYLRCVARAVKELRTTDEPACRDAARVLRCAVDSTCGQPGAVTCITPRGERSPRCRIESSAERCAKLGGTASPRKSCCPDCPG